METTVQDISAPEHKTKRAISDGWYSVLLISPAMIIIFFFALVPLFYAINISFRYVDLTKPGSSGAWVGLENFRFALNDPVFWEATGRTLTFAITAVAIEMVLGIFIAFQLAQMRWFKGIVRSLLLLPLAAAPIAVGLVWRYMYHSDFGVFNAFLSALGFPEQNWLGDLRLAMPSIIVFDIWQWTPFVAIITLAGLQSLPKEPFEAAELDGASTWQVLRRLTFPMLTPVLTLIFVLRAIDAVRLYDAVASLTRGGPGAATETLTYYLYRLGLKYFRMDQASAMSLLFLYAVVIFTGIVVRRLMREQAARAQRE